MSSEKIVNPIKINIDFSKFKKSGKYLFILIFLLVALTNSLYIVKENEFSYVTQFSKFKRVEQNAGIYFRIPFIENVLKLPKYAMFYDIPPSDVLTADKKTLVVDSYAVWKIIDPLTFMRTVSSVREMEARVNAAVYNAVRNTMGQLSQDSIISSDLKSIASLSEKIRKNADAQLKSYGVEVITAEVKRFDLPEANEVAVFTRMVSERQQMAATYIAEGELEAQKIKNEVDRDVAIIKAKADAEAKDIIGAGDGEYMKILSSAFATADRQEFYEFYRGLDALKVSMKGEKTLFIDSNSKIGKILSGK